MVTKLEIRKLIDCAKNEYTYSGDKTILVNIAILKGLYISLGGKKYITIPQKFDNITVYSSVVFKHKLNTMTNMSKDRLTSYLIKYLMAINKQPEVIIGADIPIMNNDISLMMLRLIFSEYTEDMMLKSLDIQNNTIELLNKLDERKVGV